MHIRYFQVYSLKLTVVRTYLILIYFLKAASLDLESQLPGCFYCFHQVKRPLSLTPCVQVVAQISGDKQSRGEPLKLGANGPFLVSSWLSWVFCPSNGKLNHINARTCQHNTYRIPNSEPYAPLIPHWHTVVHACVALDTHCLTFVIPNSSHSSWASTLADFMLGSMMKTVNEQSIICFLTRLTGQWLRLFL